MKILYYCPEYYCDHGGKTHARGFFHALKSLPIVKEALLYPKGGVHYQSNSNTAGMKSRGKLWFLPDQARSIIRFFIPKRRLTGAVIEEIRSVSCDVLIIRTGVIIPTIKKVKSACPNVSVCLEINSAYFDECFTWLPLRSQFQRWEVRGFLQADAIMVVSSYLKSYLEHRGVPPERIIVNQNGVTAEVVKLSNVPSVRTLYGIPENAFVLGYIGGMESFRRLPEIIHYIAKLRKEGNRDIFFIVVGDGKDMPAVRAAIAEEQDVLEDSVKIAGWQEHSDVPKFLVTFDLAIFPFTNAYCSPLKLFEYLGAGITTLGPDTPAVREVFRDGVHLKLVKQDGSNFTSAILELKSDSLLRSRLSEQGRQLVLSEYTWDKNAARVINHIQSNRHRL